MTDEEGGPAGHKPSGDSGDAFALGLLVVVAVVVVLYFLLWNTGKSLDVKDQLAAEIAGLDGDQTCLIAWVKARETGRRAGEFPSIKPARIAVDGPPRVLECGMVDADAEPVEPLMVFERCTEVDRKCVDFAR